MFLRSVNLSDIDNISVELTLALLTVDSMTSLEVYYKFRGRDNVRNIDKPIEELEYEILEFKKARQINSCHEAIIQYLLHNKIIKKADISRYEKAYIDFSISTDMDDIKYSYAKTQEFKAILSNNIPRPERLSSQIKAVLKNYNSPELANLAEYTVKTSSNYPAGHNFDTAKKWAFDMCYILERRKKDIFDIISPKSSIIKSQGEFDDLDIGSQLILEEVDFKRINDFQKTAKCIYELNKRLFYTSKSGMMYSYITYLKDKERMRIIKRALNIFDSLDMTDIRTGFSDSNRPGMKYTQPRYSTVTYDSFHTIVRSRESLLEVYKEYSPYNFNNIIACYEATLNQQRNEQAKQSKNNILTFFSNDGNISAKGATPEQIFLIVYIGLGVTEQFINQITSQGLNILDIPDKIFYDESYIRRFNSFEDYMTCHNIVEELDQVNPDKMQQLTGLYSSIPDNKKLIENYELQYLDPSTYVGIELIPLKDLLDNAKSYDESFDSLKSNDTTGKLIRNNKIRDNVNANKNASMKSSILPTFGLIDISFLVTQTQIFYTYWERFTKVGIINALKNIPGDIATTAYTSDGYYSLATLASQDINKDLNNYLSVFKKLLADYLGMFAKYTKDRNFKPVVTSEEFLRDEYLIPIINLAINMTKKYGSKGLAIFMLRFYVLLSYATIKVTDITNKLLRACTAGNHGTTRKEILFSKENSPNNLEYISILKIIDSEKDFLNHFINLEGTEVSLIKPELNLSQLIISDAFNTVLKETGLSWIIEPHDVENRIPDDYLLNEMFREIVKLLPYSFTDRFLYYYANMCTVFIENKVSNKGILDPYTYTLKLKGSYATPGVPPRAIPPDLEVREGYYTYKGLAVKVRKKDCIGYLHWTGNVIYPDNPAWLEGSCELFDDDHLIVEPMILKEKYLL